MREPIGLEIKHEVVKINGKIPYRKFSAKGREHFNLKIYVEGDLSKLESVEYNLHPTFRFPRREIYDASDGFPLEIWTWGEFDIEVVFNYTDGAVGSKIHHLLYSDMLSNNADDYIDVSNR